MKLFFNRIGAMTIALVLLLPAVPALGNAAPVFWRGQAASMVLTLDHSSGIHVRSERLTFDFENEFTYFAPLAVVTAEYGLWLDSAVDQTSTMAFPIITSLDRFQPDQVRIDQDGNPLPYRIRLAGAEHLTEESPQSEYGIDYEGLFASITEVRAPSVLRNRLGTRHTLHVEGGQQGFVTVELQGTAGELGFFKGFNSYSQREGRGFELTLGGHVEENRLFEVFSTATELPLVVHAYTDWERKTPLTDFRYEWTTEPVDAATYLMDDIQQARGGYLPLLDVVEEEELLALLEAQVLRQETAGYFSDVAEVTEIFYYDQMVVLLYEVALEGQKEHTVTVSYLAEGTYDRSATKHPIYRYTYLLQPARYFESFQDLEVTVRTPDTMPYMPESYPTLVETDARVYQGSFDTLPQREELQFVLYQEPVITNLTLWDRLFSSYTLLFLGVFALPLLLLMSLLGLTYVLLRRRRRA